jgi:hypothetical protein
MSFSFGICSRDLTKAGPKVNELVREFPALKLTGYSKWDGAALKLRAPFFNSVELKFVLRPIASLSFVGRGFSRDIDGWF